MKVLCFYADHFSYTIGDKNHEAADEAALPGRFAACIVAKAPVTPWHAFGRTFDLFQQSFGLRKATLQEQ